MLFVLPLLLALGDISGCVELRRETIQRTFSELDRVTGHKVFDEDTMVRFVGQMPWYGRWAFNKWIKPKGGVNYVIHRCASGSDPYITEQSMLANVNTCFSKCIFVKIVKKCIDWGYADYYKS